MFFHVHSKKSGSCQQEYIPGEGLLSIDSTLYVRGFSASRMDGSTGEVFDGDLGGKWKSIPSGGYGVLCVCNGVITGSGSVLLRARPIATPSKAEKFVSKMSDMLETREWTRERGCVRDCDRPWVDSTELEVS